MKKQKFSQAAHLLHSRLQMVSEGLIIKADNMGVINAPNLVWQNKWLFYRAKEAVESEHGLQVSLKDLTEAAALIVVSKTTKFTGLYQVQQKVDDKWTPVKIRAGRASFVQAGQEEYFSFGEAAEMYAYIAVLENDGAIRIMAIN